MSHSIAGVKSKTIISLEKRRALFHRVLRQQPDHDRVYKSLMATLKPKYIRSAARQGVFVSYNRADELIALDLDTELRSQDINMWLDVIDIEDEVDWRGEVDAALHRCGVMLLILSPSSVMDQDVQKEYRYAINAGKIVIPLLYESCDYDHMHIILKPIDFRYDSQRALKQLSRVLVNA